MDGRDAHAMTKYPEVVICADVAGLRWIVQEIESVLNCPIPRITRMFWAETDPASALIRRG
jgi:hypothetical protein